MSIEEFISQQAPERQKLLTGIHAVIVEADQTVTPVIAPMMGKEMIIYNAGAFKYGLASVKKYMSLHVLPMYGSKVLYDRYKERLPRAGFQKGCINFVNEEEMPLAIVKELMTDCAKIDLRKMREEYLAGKKAKNKTVK